MKIFCQESFHVLQSTKKIIIWGNILDQIPNVTNENTRLILIMCSLSTLKTPE